MIQFFSITLPPHIYVSKPVTVSRSRNAASHGHCSIEPLPICTIFVLFRGIRQFCAGKIDDECIMKKLKQIRIHLFFNINSDLNLKKRQKYIR